MELLKTVPAYSWLFIYFRKYKDLRKIVKNPLKKIVKTTFDVVLMCSYISLIYEHDKPHFEMPM